MEKNCSLQGLGTPNGFFGVVIAGFLDKLRIVSRLCIVFKKEMRLLCFYSRAKWDRHKSTHMFLEYHNVPSSELEHPGPPPPPHPQASVSPRIGSEGGGHTRVKGWGGGFQFGRVCGLPPIIASGPQFVAGHPFQNFENPVLFYNYRQNIGNVQSHTHGPVSCKKGELYESLVDVLKIPSKYL